MIYTSTCTHVRNSIPVQVFPTGLFTHVFIQPSNLRFISQEWIMKVRIRKERDMNIWINVHIGLQSNHTYLVLKPQLCPYLECGSHYKGKKRIQFVISELLTPIPSYLTCAARRCNSPRGVATRPNEKAPRRCSYLPDQVFYDWDIMALCQFNAGRSTRTVHWYHGYHRLSSREMCTKTRWAEQGKSMQDWSVY